jgi:hypothetical protein
LGCHHRYYLPGKEPWDYPDNALVTLCEDCHIRETESRDAYEKELLLAFRHHFFAGELPSLSTRLQSVSAIGSPGIIWMIWPTVQHEITQLLIVHESYNDPPKWQIVYEAWKRIKDG